MGKYTTAMVIDVNVDYTGGCQLTLVDINPQSPEPIFSHYVDKKYGIQKKYLVRFDNDVGRLVPPIHYYETHAYEHAIVLGKDMMAHKLLMFGHKIGEIEYDVANSAMFRNVNYIDVNDELLLKIPHIANRYIDIIHNITQERRRHDFAFPLVGRRAWVPIKYTFARDGKLK
ncbi:MAG: hypothetical protein IJ560_02200 [Alphaproteobacteria bacterium]|nr:hypothetical protein [Alphaproteobacteria bacterium]